MYGEDLRKRFPALAPVVDDLFLLEPHQIACLPQRAPRGELATVLREYPELVRFFSVRHPPIEPFLSDLLHAAPSLEMDLAECEDRLLWELADLIVYQFAVEPVTALRAYGVSSTRACPTAQGKAWDTPSVYTAHPQTR